MSLQPGQTILNGKYRIQRLIGEGGMARVWLAEELTFGSRAVALKEPRDDLLPEAAHEMKQRYQREVQVCAALEKARVPNIVRAFTAEPCDDTLLLAMEYMPGGDLTALLKQHPDGLPLERAVRITLDLLQALEGVHAHELEIVHRDVKPSNVLFDEEGRAHLADFGLAQLAGMSGRSQLAGGQHPGTPMYMAPEQEASPRALTPAADLYAVGCILFDTLTGKRYKRVRPGTLPSALRPEVPGWLEEIITKALAEDPWERYQHAEDMARPLREGLQREAEERARARAAEEARQRQAEERARAQAAEEARRWQAEERARAQAAEEARWQEAEARRPMLEKQDSVSQPPRRAERPRPMHWAAWFWPAVGAAGVLVIAMALWLLLGGGGDGSKTPAPEPTQIAAVEATATFTLPATDAPTPTKTVEPANTAVPMSSATAGLSTTSLTPSSGVPLSVQASISGAPLSSLEISLWPEFDRPDMLLIYRGSFTPSTEVPVPVEFRIPARVGQLHAVAWIDEGGHNISQPYTNREEGEWLVISFELPTLDFHIEYYDELLKDSSGTREYRYAFLAGCDIASVTLDFQVPRAAQTFTLDPAADSVVQASDNMTYHLVEAGSLSQGQSRSWALTYWKDD